MALRRIDPPTKEVKQRINESIRVPQVRVVSELGEQLGVMNTYEALSMARQAELDLVEVASDSKPPVCRIMDFGKFRYQQKKKQTKQNAHQTRLKEVHLRPKTGEHDIMVKVNQVRGFLQNKDKVQISIVFKGRELAHFEEGEKVLSVMIAALDDIGKIEAPPKRADKRIICTVVPK
ncbi:MAG: translation initiation factor IF-3 [Thermoguttaceae bacterium]